jgi:hypothetical protein
MSFFHCNFGKIRCIIDPSKSVFSLLNLLKLYPEFCVAFKLIDKIVIGDYNATTYNLVQYNCAHFLNFT